MNKHEESVRNFLVVRDMLNSSENVVAYRLCWKKPYKFYREHTPEKAIAILKREAAKI